MLYKLHTNLLIVGLLSIGFLVVKSPDRAWCLTTAGTLFAYITQLCLLINFSQENIYAYLEKTLFFTVLIYSIIVGFLFMWISYYYAGDTYMFSKDDAFFYLRVSSKAVDIGFLANAKQIIKDFDFSDWGGFIFTSLILSIYPSKYLLNAYYILTGAVSSVLLYRIGKYIMPKMYAFEAALAYGTSSYLVFFHCTFLKESGFVFLVICALYFYYKSIAGGNNWTYFGTFLFLSLILCFRPAVTALLALSFMIYYGITQRGRAVSVFIYLIAAVLFVAFLAKMQTMTDEYTGGDVDAMQDRNTVSGYSSGFSLLVSWFAAPFGPFPTLFPKEVGKPSTLMFYGAGLMYRLFLALPFWIGVYLTVKRKMVYLAPMIIFIVLEMCATAFVFGSLELRKVLLHVPFMLIVTFYGLYEWNNCRRTDIIRRLSESTWIVFGLLILVAWSVIR